MISEILKTLLPGSETCISSPLPPCDGFHHDHEESSLVFKMIGLPAKTL